MGLSFACVRKSVSGLLSLLLARTAVNVVDEIHIFVFRLVVSPARDQWTVLSPFIGHDCLRHTRVCSNYEHDICVVTWQYLSSIWSIVTAGTSAVSRGHVNAAWLIISGMNLRLPCAVLILISDSDCKHVNSICTLHATKSCGLHGYWPNGVCILSPSLHQRTKVMKKTNARSLMGYEAF